MKPTAEEIRDHPFVRWLRRNAPDAPFCVLDKEAVQEFHTRNPDLQELRPEDRLSATLAPDHILFDSHGLFTTREIVDPKVIRRVRVEAPFTQPTSLTLLVIDAGSPDGV